MTDRNEAVDLGRIGFIRDAKDPSRFETLPRKKPRLQRAETWAVANIRMESGDLREGVVFDLSRSGARVKMHQRCEAPSTVFIECPRFRLYCAARVVWQDGFDIGVEFFEPSVEMV